MSLYLYFQIVEKYLVHLSHKFQYKPSSKQWNIELYYTVRVSGQSTLAIQSAQVQFIQRNLQHVSVNTCCSAGKRRVDTERRYVSFRLTSMRERVTRVNLLSEFNARKWWFMRFRASLMRSLRTPWMTGLCNKSCKRGG